MKNQKGITLIALVITIIVLLILAGVSIAMLMGENGILTQATKSKTRNAWAEAADRINMALNGEYTMLMTEGKFSATSAADLKTANGLTEDYYVVTPDTLNPTGSSPVLTITVSKDTLGTDKDVVGMIKYTGGKYSIERAPYPPLEASAGE